MVHFDAANPRPLQGWVRGANANLDCPVSVLQAFEVSQDFHARHSATARHYRYLIYNDAVRPALGADYVTWVRHPLDADSMHAHAQALLGEQDFSSFRASSCQSSTPMRRVDRASVRRSGALIVFDITANAFLHHMVRNIAGALIAVVRGGVGTDWLAQLLHARDRTLAPDTAPASGLYLVGVDYPVEHGLEAPEKGPWFTSEPA
jgi:tRNA pseudouridine38-40 synthase